MKAYIDVTTIAGKSLEGFPVEVQADFNFIEVKLMGESLSLITDSPLNPQRIKLHPGDKITIEILP